MTPTDFLLPQIGLVSQEFVLVQAWRKTAAYIRYHNWYSDTLELDRVAVNLPHFLSRLAEELGRPDSWEGDFLRLVPAPKSQSWHVSPTSKLWQPVHRQRLASQIRPLAHVSLRDQVAATAVMLCLADRVESQQHDPRVKIADPNQRRHMQSYGNRLYCSTEGKNLHHRWASKKLYRQYFQDYQSFLSRPEVVARETAGDVYSKTVIVQSDLSQFFDRVTPELLSEKVGHLQVSEDEGPFFALANRVFDWRWHSADVSKARLYAESAGIDRFTRIALPQGLVASGFFSNVVLLDFDVYVREQILTEIYPGIVLHDICRYVDDFRVVLKVDPGILPQEIEEVTSSWLQQCLDAKASGLQTSPSKTRAATFGDDDRPLIVQSRRMARVQAAISGGFDAIAGEEILDAIEGLIRSQQRFSQDGRSANESSLSPVPDTKDATVKRFAAGRFRTTYRSIRPLLERQRPLEDASEDSFEQNEAHHGMVRTQSELDEEARVFAMGLVESWMEDPSNVRLLRIGLDIWPSQDFLVLVLARLRPYTENVRHGRPQRWIAWYCLAELFRAAATETGIVEDSESMPASIDLSAYRRLLIAEAGRLMALPSPFIPWYLEQQTLLFLAAFAPFGTTLGLDRSQSIHEDMIVYLSGQSPKGNSAHLATLAILARRAFTGPEKAGVLSLAGIGKRNLEQIASRDPAFAVELLQLRPELHGLLTARIQQDLCISEKEEREGWICLTDLVLNVELRGTIRNELSLLEFASAFLALSMSDANLTAITPDQVLLRAEEDSATIREIREILILRGAADQKDSMYAPPKWSDKEESWRFQLGYLIRFILAGEADFAKVGKKTNWRDIAEGYRVPCSHWYERLYGLYNEQSTFGDDWLPISEWIESFLSALLCIPGSADWALGGWNLNGPNEARSIVALRLKHLRSIQGHASGCMVLPVRMPRPVRGSDARPLRACVMQTVIPASSDFQPTDLTLSAPMIRIRHRAHLSAALAAIERMLDLRETHKGSQGRLDWLILPELAVHPRDIQTHLVPFARKHKTIILAGITYEQPPDGGLLVNSAHWIYPAWSLNAGVRILVRRQGKQHLSAEEDQFNAVTPTLRGFRPCQWLLGYEWSPVHEDPLWLTASVCYDATDLGLAADLRHVSDVLAIPALNRDVNTFDQMALALHYHMFQLVIVSNNGTYGGSNAHAPYREPYNRQVFHLHGQPQASIAFLEIDDIAEYLARKATAKILPKEGEKPNVWKYPPACL
jgi:Reverse transcriptase (RNA-dependent DNA polymerase)